MAAGKAILIASSDLPDRMEICHRILMFSNGRIPAGLPRAECSEEWIRACALQDHPAADAGPADDGARA